MAIDERTRKFLARQGSPKAAAAICDALDAGSSTASEATEREDAALTVDSVVTANTNATVGHVTQFNLTSGSLTLTAPALAVGATFGGKVLTAGAGHTLTFNPHGSETFDGAAHPVLAAAGAEKIYTSHDGVNWVTAA